MKKQEILNNIREYSETVLPTPNKFKPGIDDVPVSGAVIFPDDLVSVCDTVLDGWFTEGIKAKKFADLLSDYLGIQHVLLCNSGSSANLLAIEAVKDFYKIKGEKKVITCATGFSTTVASIIQVGLIPLFVDVDPLTLNPSTDTVLSLLEKDDVVGIIQAHTLGFPFDAISVCETCARHRKFFIEDCADCLGALIDEELTGRFGDISTFSFFPAHHICCGEGGALAISNNQIARNAKSYRDWGKGCYCLPGETNMCNNRFGYKWKNLPEGFDHKYTFTKVGYNLKMTEMQAALGVSQFANLQDFINARKENYAYLRDGLEELQEHLQFVRPLLNAEPSPFGFPMSVISTATTRKGLVNYLEQHRIRTRPVFAGNITRHPMMEDVQYEVAEELNGSDWIMEHTFWIGCHPGLTSTHLDYVLETFYKYFKKEI
jgi:CDP-6-deoxy-D-xylo-4-hexulose-3-dehydrase